MEPLHYKLVFSVADPSYRPWLGSAIACAGVAILALFLPLVARPWQLGFSSRDKLILSVIALLIVLVVTGNFVVSFRDWKITRQLLNSSQAPYVEGRVENFVPMPYSGHAVESFDVNGVPFRYSDYIITAGFNNTSSHGGPIHEGLPVHIWYRDAGSGTGNEILKLEIAGN